MKMGGQDGSDLSFERLRLAEFADLGDSVYLNAASLGPLPARAAAAMREYGEKRLRVHLMRDSDFLDPLRRVRERAAALIGAGPDEIAMAPSTSFGINLAAVGLRVPAGSTVLATNREFPANVLPWMDRNRLQLEMVPVGPEGNPDEARLLERVAAGGVGILAISSVQFTTGFRADLAVLGRACREQGTFLVVDAIQSLGQVHLDVAKTPVDVLATGSHKWLCGPFGAGFVYVRREVQDRMDPVFVGWTAVRSGQQVESVLDYGLDFLPDARRYECGTPPFQDLAGLAESLDLLLEAGVPRIEEYVASLLDPLRSWLRGRPGVELLGGSDPLRHTGIVACRVPETRETYRALRRAGIVCSVREGALRFAAHLYNTEHQIGRLLDVLDGRAAGGWS